MIPNHLSFIALLLLLLLHYTTGLETELSDRRGPAYPLVVATWPFKEAVRAAWRSVNEKGSSAVDAVIEGCSACEELRCDGTVGPGGSPDENGETTLDALIMNGVDWKIRGFLAIIDFTGMTKLVLTSIMNSTSKTVNQSDLLQTTMEVGAVAAMRFVKDGIRAAKLVMDHTEHTLLVGEMASIFAISMGLDGPTNLSSSESIEKWSNWKQHQCQPNFRKNVFPKNGCGPYHVLDELNFCGEAEGQNCFGDLILRSNVVGRNNHDTISMAVIDKWGHIAVGTSTNGATFKIPGRVGDGPIAGSSAYADDEVGACGATGDGDVMMRFLPCYQVVESMRQGMEPQTAASDAISRIARKFPNFVGAIVAVNWNGVHAGACHGWTFQYSVMNSTLDDVEIITVVP